MSLKDGGFLGGLLTIIALVIALLTQISEFLVFFMFGLKLILILAFVGVIVLVGFLAVRTWQKRRRES